MSNLLTVLNLVASRIEGLERRLSGLEHGFKAESGASFAGYSPFYAFAMCPGSAGYGIPGITWVRIGTETATNGVYEATVLLPSGQDGWVDHPNMATIQVYAPDLEELTEDTIVPVQFEGMDEQNNPLYCAIRPGSGAVYVTTVESQTGAVVAAYKHGSQTETIDVYVGEQEFEADDEILVFELTHEHLSCKWGGQSLKQAAGGGARMVQVTGGSGSSYTGDFIDDMGSGSISFSLDGYSGSGTIFGVGRRVIVFPINGSYYATFIPGTYFN
jgi:hypothetical protein